MFYHSNVMRCRRFLTMYKENWRNNLPKLSLRTWICCIVSKRLLTCLFACSWSFNSINQTHLLIENHSMYVCIYDHPVQFNPCCNIHPVSTNKAEPNHDMIISSTNVTYMTRRNVRCKQSCYRMYGPVFVLYGEFFGIEWGFCCDFLGRFGWGFGGELGDDL